MIARLALEKTATNVRHLTAPLAKGVAVMVITPALERMGLASDVEAPSARHALGWDARDAMFSSAVDASDSIVLVVSSAAAQRRPVSAFRIFACVGPLCEDGGNCHGADCKGGDGDPDDPDDPDESCTGTAASKTVGSSCEVSCTQSPINTVSMTTVCGTECDTSTTCGASDTSSTTTALYSMNFPTPYFDAFLGIEETGTAEIVLAFQSGMAEEDSTDAITDPPTTTPPGPTTTTKTTTSPTTTTSADPAFPTSTDGSAPILCFGAGDHIVLSSEDADAAIGDLCGQGTVVNTLTPGQNFDYVVEGGSGVVASLGWASDQSGCLPKTDFRLEGEACANLFNDIGADCGDDNFGGGWIWNGDFGCVEISIGEAS
ncbi:hypothetical protein LTR17_008696 [Elasticomyces elasticus]|nr:hypothetical protein LTR17_008696 [Elasticomyces elasticus]